MPILNITHGRAKKSDSLNDCGPSLMPLTGVHSTHSAFGKLYFAFDNIVSFNYAASMTGWVLGRHQLELQASLTKDGLIIVNQTKENKLPSGMFFLYWSLY